MKTKILLKHVAFIVTIITTMTYSQVVSGQDTLSIASGQDNAGLLETTINNDVDGDGNRLNPNRVYKLDAGFHFVQSAIDVNNDGGTITIVGATGGTKPVIIPLVVNDIAPEKNKINSNLTLKNVHMQGRDTEGAYWGGRMWELKGNDRSLIVHDCVMESASRGFHLQKVKQGLTMEFRNNYFRDFHDASQLWAGNVMDAKNIPIESFIFENNTVSNGNCVLLLQGNFINYALINHNTFINTSTFLNLNPYWYEAYITNNVFINANMIGSEFNLIANEPDKVVFPIIAIDTLDINIGTAAIPAYAKNADETALVAPYNSIDNYKIYLADNIYHNEATLQPYYTGTYNDLFDSPVSYLSWYAPGPHEVDVPAKWTDMREASFFANNVGIVEENNILDQDPELATTALTEGGAEALAIWMRKMFEVADETRTPDFSTYFFGDFNPLTVPGIEAEDGDGITKISDFVEDFSISTSFTSKNDGHSIGALHWTNEIEDFDSDESLSDIIIAYNNALTAGLEDTLYIAAGQDNAGLLETTINSDVDDSGNRLHPNRVYKLDAGFHFVQSAIDVNNDGGTITIVGATGGTKPVIIPLVVNDVAPARNEINSNLTLKNVHMQGRNTEGAYWGGQMWNVKGNDRSLIVHDCVMEFASRGFYLQEVPQGLKMEFRNNYFRDFHDESQLWAGNVMDAKNIPIESLIFENNTVSNGNCVLLLQGNFINYALINHNTFINTSTFLNLNPYWYEAYITNNVFVNANMIGSEFNLIANEPDKVVFPIIAIDTLDINIGTAAIPAYAKNEGETALVAPYNSIDNYKIYLADNIYHNEATLDPYYAGTYNDLYDSPVSYLSWYAAGPHEVDVPAKWTAAREASFFANNVGVVEQNNILDQDPELATTALSEAGAEAMAIWMRKMYEVADETRTPDFSTYFFGDFNPLTVPGIETEDGVGVTRISDFVEDFSINSSFVSKSDGYKIGALHWSADIDDFDSDESLTMIKTSYEAAQTTSVKDIAIGDDKTLIYPNPAAEMTIVNFELNESSHVKLTVYDLHGKKIETLLNQKLPKGQHDVNWNVSNIASGIYMVTFEVGNYKTIRKMVVN